MDIRGSVGAVSFRRPETKGSETVFVNNIGKVIEISSRTEPVAGNNIYLTIDRDLQIAAYKILEENLAGILCTNIINAKEFDPGSVSASNIKIPIYDVYFALINNNVIDTRHFESANAGGTEKAVHEKFLTRKEIILSAIFLSLSFWTCCIRNHCF